MSEMIERVARAIEEAQHKDREGPFGLYDYTTYGDPVPHHVRDFRDARSPTYGNAVFKTADHEAARVEYERLTQEHIARAAIEAMREPGLAIRKITTFEFAEVEWPKLIDATLASPPTEIREES